jgi:hypothetical protein
MTAITSSELPAVSRRVLHFQLLTIAWMTIEVVISLRAAWSSHSPALFAFGGDSMIGLLSAAVAFWRFRIELSELRATQIAGVLLFALAALVMLTSVTTFIGYCEAQRGAISCMRSQKLDSMRSQSWWPPYLATGDERRERPSVNVGHLN